MNYRLRLLFLSGLDALTVATAVTLAYLLRFDFRIDHKYLAVLPYAILMQVLLLHASFIWTKMYRRVWQYASIGELVSLLKAATTAEILFYIIHKFIYASFPNLLFPRSIFIISWVLIILGVGASRFAWRIFRDSYLKIQPHHRRTLIIGAGKAGVLIAKELKHSPDSDLYPVAFIDDDQTKWNLEVLGLPVLGGRDRIPEVIFKHSIQKIVIAIPSASRAEISKIIEICKSTKAKIKILPRVSDLITSKVSINMIREVSVDDLLGRDPVQVDLNEIAGYVTWQVVLVTGAGGSIGSELCRQIAPFKPRKLLLLGHGENSIYDIALELKKSFPNLVHETIIADIQDAGRIRQIFSTYRPTVVFHAAAHKHVPLMEANPAEAVKNNIFGTKNLAECAHQFGVDRFVMISTDKAVNPTSVMGTTKRVAEMIIQSIGRTSSTKFAFVRFGNVLGSRGSVIPLFKRQIMEGGPVTVTHPEMVRYFMTIPEAVQLVIQAGALAQGGDIFILDMGKPVKIVDLARDLIQLSGLEPYEDIKIVYTGLRPGEKLFEEILTDEEGLRATKHNRIFIGKQVEFSWEELSFMIKKLHQIIYSNNPIQSENIKELLKQIVPTYQLGNPGTRAVDSHSILRNTSPTKETALQELQLAAEEVAVNEET
ncbi:MAG: nucleoside-diphosphate sugar epimerase/dehydratase [Thermincola sp.]|jgi:FlaA1/EpsC-like NDP-sugar epimerase|nr:nucleoside-diphosphate sugar epimerase/dehydratase [Thermincola sp.]MDT3704687.1 nucleoside-diphosphate sugar epimerase/dehydratase [Thermincola sp.]